MKLPAKKVSKTSQDKEKSRKLRKSDYVKLLADANKWPLAIRIAAELFRGKISGREFQDSFHIEGNSFSTQVLHHMVEFDLKKGYDPEKIPAVLPVFLRYVSTEKQKEAKEKCKKGRPTFEQAKEVLLKVLADLKTRGWWDVDFINAFRDLVDTPSKPIAKVVLDDFDDDEEPVKEKQVKTFYARIGKKWETFTTKTGAENAMEVDDDKILGPVIPPVKGEHCSCCGFRLNGTVITLREEDKVEHLHMGCYWMSFAHPSQLVKGMRFLSALEGVYYEYVGPENGGWKKDEKVSGGASPGGVPSLSGEENKQAEALPVKES